MSVFFSNYTRPAESNITGDVIRAEGIYQDPPEPFLISSTTPTKDVLSKKRYVMIQGMPIK